jgi:hypothetical protein
MDPTCVDEGSTNVEVCVYGPSRVALTNKLDSDDASIGELVQGLMQLVDEDSGDGAPCVLSDWISQLETGTGLAV